MAVAARIDKPISIAVMAMGGQGGGVLTDWIVDVAERSGWFAQATSIPGVAQRTGATIYYIEAIPRDPRRSGEPVLALSPVAGDVDIVIAAELMEAGRAIQRGFVTPDKTVLIASSHRSYAVSEKSKPGDGIADSGKVIAAGRKAARQFVHFDMAAEAERGGTLISSVLLGALAGAEALPFERGAFEQAIRAGGVGVDASLRAFGRAYDQAREEPTWAGPAGKTLPELPSGAMRPELDGLVDRIRRDVAVPVQRMAFAGLKRVVDFQDPAYGDEYLTRLTRLHALDQNSGGGARGYALSIGVAKELAVAMCYDDVVRVAALKTNARRFTRVRDEVGATDEQIVYTTEFMHPRAEEMVGMLPAGLGRAITARPRLLGALDRVVNRGRRVRTGTVFWFVALYAIAGLRRFRRSTLRHREETDRINGWLKTVEAHGAANYDLACEIVKCRRLIKGYSDTHARGLSKYDRVLGSLALLQGRPDAADWLRRLRDAALLDEEGTALDGAIATVATL